jgi:hypothetical protein
MHRRIASLTLATVALLTACSPSPREPGVPSPSSDTPAFSPLPAGMYAIMCGADAHAPNAVVVLSPDVYRLGGWNHVNGVGSFESVALESSAYAVGAKQYLPDATCGGANTLDLVLAKKTYDWDKQHANGIESQFPGDELTFGEIGAIVLDIRLDPARSVLPSAAEYEAAYGDLLSAQQLAELDGGKVNLELTLFGSGSAGDQPPMNAGLIIEIDPEEFGDGWLRVKVPREDLVFYTEENYERTVVGPDVNQDALVHGLRINPETSSGNEARFYVGDAFDPRAKEELFKEMAIAFHTIEIERIAP